MINFELKFLTNGPTLQVHLCTRPMWLCETALAVSLAGVTEEPICEQASAETIFVYMTNKIFPRELIGSSLRARSRPLFKSFW